ncbi:hypothetical protein VKT23_001659 [Stygiomarasmius scandens]|uniref:Diphthamide biosynthesis protein 3 n=1 Tax=Marasmiellus scandens TaxID=2682957 RepID=A0ABR1K3A6_9AGAR
MDPSSTFIDFYQILSISPASSFSQIKSAYHRALLQHHPDKSHQYHGVDGRTQTYGNGIGAMIDAEPERNVANGNNSPILSISTIKQAYLVLSDPALRAEHDATRARNQPFRPLENHATGPRPAQLIDLSDFTEVPVARPCSNGSFSDDRNKDGFEYTHPCRCGGMYKITEAQMERGEHLVGCESCSEVVWVSFEVAEDDEDS